MDKKKVVHRGWLAKRGHVVKNVKMRWFVLTEESLTYYKKSPSSIYEEKAKGVIPLRVCTVFDSVPGGSTKFSFLLITSSGKKYEIMANSEESKDIWLKMICSQNGVMQSPKNKKANCPFCTKNEQKKQMKR